MSGDFVLDNSVVMTWFRSGRADEGTRQCLARLAEERALVPQIFPIELANVLVQLERRGLTSAAETRAFLDLVETLPIDIDPVTAGHAWAETLHLARAHRLSAYDAAYLELALRHGVPLATRDRRLARACEAVGLGVL